MIDRGTPGCGTRFMACCSRRPSPLGHELELRFRDRQRVAAGPGAHLMIRKTAMPACLLTRRSRWFKILFAG